jgi:oligopeptidase B
MNTRSLYKKRNITKKSYTYFKDNLHKYLSIEERSKIKGVNDLLKYTKYPKPVKIVSTLRHHKVAFYEKEIKKHLIDTDYSVSGGYPRTKVKYSKKANYVKYYNKKSCSSYDILNIDKLAAPFVFFNMTSFQWNPSETHLLFGVDFIGNRCYHLFIKSLYSNEIKELDIPKRSVVDTKNMYGNESTVSDNFTWLTDTTIAYIGLNQYYNHQKAYVYNIENKSIYSFAKIPHGYFGVIDTADDNQYVILSINDYNSNEIYIMDNDAKLKLGEPILKRQFSVKYPFIEHVNGEWILHERNKGTDTLKRTKDFKSYHVDYVNKNPNQQIIKVRYLEDMYIFIVCHLKGFKLYKLACGKLTLKIDESVGYINFNTAVAKNTYYISHYLTPTHKSTDAYKPKYYEKKVYIKKDLFFTVLSKKKPHLSKCLLIGYGAYNTIETPHYTAHYVALISLGWTIVIAHLRGGGEYGYRGYDDGRLLNKKNTFIDFITTADYLVEHKITTSEQLAIWGRSAGGLLIANVLNIRPNICKFAILGAPFVLPIKNMSTYKVPLGIESQSEFGDPHFAKEIDPISNINLKHDYPNIFIYTNYYDTLVPYKESLAYYRAMKEADVFKKKKINLYIDNKYGHTQGSSVDSKIHTYAVIFDQLIAVFDR